MKYIKKPKILQLARDISGTGGGNIVINTSLFFVRQGVEVIVITDSPVSELSDVGIKVLIIPFGQYLYKLRTKNKISRTLRHTLQILNFIIFSAIFIPIYKTKGFVVVNNNNEAIYGDIISIHNVFSAEAFGNSASFFRGLLRLLNPVMFIRVMKEQLILRYSNNSDIIANSVETLNEISRYISSKARTVVIPSGVDIDKFNFKNQLHIKPLYRDNFIVVFVGHEFERKGLRYLISALTILPENVILWVVGGRGSTVNSFEKMVNEHKLKKRVLFMGTKTDLPTIYSSAHVFALPSAYEGLPLVCLESMACGLPNLVTFVGGMKELIIDGENGYFVKRDPEDIAQKISELYVNKEHYSYMRAAARKTALEYSWENIGNQYLSTMERNLLKNASFS